MKTALRYMIVLTLICCITGGGIAVVYAAFEQRIEQNDRTQYLDTLKSVLPPGDIKIVSGDEYSEGAVYGSFDAQGKPLGYAAQGAQQGYSSKVRIMVGVTAAADLPIYSVAVLSQQETPGLGANVSQTTSNYNLWQKIGIAPAPGKEQRVNSFLTRFDDKTLDNINAVDAMTAATITSDAVKRAVEKAIDRIRDVATEKPAAPSSPSTEEPANVRSQP